MFEWIKLAIDELISISNIYIAITTIVLLHQVFYLLMQRIRKNQHIKKKVVKQKIHELKEPYREKNEIIEARETIKQKTMDFFAKWDNFTSNKDKWSQAKESLGNVVANQKMIEALRFEKHLSEEELNDIQEKSKKIIKEEKHKLGLSILAFLIPIVILLLFIGQFHAIKDIPHATTLVWITVILSFFSHVTRKTVMIFIIIAIISYFIYRKLSGAALVFICIYAIVSGLVFRIQNRPNKKRKGDLI